MNTLYTAKVTVVGGRDGYATTGDDRLAVQLSRTDSEQLGTNPEQLFAAGYGACFGSAVAAVAKRDNITVEEIKVQPEVSLNKSDTEGFFISVVINVTLDGVPQSEADNLVKSAHEMCPYSKAIKNNVEVKLVVNGKEIA